MPLTIKVNASQLDAICWEAKRNINSEISEDTPGTMGTLSAILSEEGLQPPFYVHGSRGFWNTDTVPYLLSVTVAIMANHEPVNLTVIPG